MFWNVKDGFTFLNASAGMDTTVVWGVVAHLELIIVSSSVSHPTEHGLESLFFSRDGHEVVFFLFLLSVFKQAFNFRVLAIKIKSFLQLFNCFIS